MGLDRDLIFKALATAVAVGVSFTLYRLLLRMLHRRMEDVARFYTTRKTITYIYFVLLTLILIVIWSEGLSQLSTYIGLLSAGIAIALKDPLTNIAGFLFILVRKPFDAGDRIEIAGQSGDVIDKRVFMFTLMEIGNWVHADQSTGRIIHLPNNLVFTHPIANYTKGFSHIWNEIEVLVTFESDWRRAKTILSDIAEEHAGHLSATAEERLKQAARQFMIRYGTLTPIVYTRVDADGVCLTIRYLTDPRNRRNSAQTLWEAILDRFDDEPSIQLAYRTLRVTTSDSEKSDTKTGF